MICCCQLAGTAACWDCPQFRTWNAPREYKYPNDMVNKEALERFREILGNNNKPKEQQLEEKVAALEKRLAELERGGK